MEIVYAQCLVGLIVCVTKRRINNEDEFSVLLTSPYLALPVCFYGAHGNASPLLTKVR